MFVGFVNLEDTLNAPVLLLDSARTPVNADGPPVVRVYGPLGLLTAATTAAAELDGANISSASSEVPILITSAGHSLTTGTYIHVQGVGGQTAANGSFTITVVDGDTFTLDGSVSTGAYTSGGRWNVAGLYLYSVECKAANGFEAGTTYYVVIEATVAGVPTADQQTFIVT